MKQSFNLNEIERKVFLSFHNDGLIDLFLCFIMLVSILSSSLTAAGVTDSIRIVVYVPLMVVAGPWLYMLGKKNITFPRLGYVKLTGKRTKYRLVIFVILSAVLVTLVLMTAINGSNKTNNTVMGINEEIWSSVFMTGIILGVFFLIALLMSVNRFYLLGLLVGLSEPLLLVFSRFTQTGNPGLFAYGIPALLLCISGILTLNRFMEEYPLYKEAQSLDEMQNKT